MIMHRRAVQYGAAACVLPARYSSWPSPVCQPPRNLAAVAVTRYDGGMAKGCIICGRDIHSKRADAKFCSTKCRVSHHRSKALPAELTTVPRWVRWMPSDGRKRPLMANGAPASVTDPATWSDYTATAASKAGVGLGFVLTDADDIACIDIDDCVTDGVVSPAALELARGTAGVFWVELSPSRQGIHIWHRGPNGPGTNRVENGIRVERYSTARYLTVTGLRVTI